MNYTKDLEDALVSLRDERDAANARVSELEAENKQMRRFLDEATANNVRLHEKFSPLEAENAALKVKADNLNTHLVSVINQRDTANARADAAEKHATMACVAVSDYEKWLKAAEAGRLRDLWAATEVVINDEQLAEIREHAAALQDGPVKEGE